MQTLPTETKHGCYLLKQVERTPTTAIYAKTNPKFKNPNRVIAYEAFIIKVSKPHTWPNGNTSPEHEAYPGDNAFGKSAWSCSTLERAKARLDQHANGMDLRRKGVV